MSTVRMCDKCGKIFSENTDGWQTFTGATVRRGSDGVRRSEVVSMDACTSCAFQPDAAPVPEITQGSTDV